MKYRFFTIGLVAILFAACSVNEMDITDPINDNAEEFFASIEDASTKVFVDDKLRVLWNADDRVSIFNKYTFNQEYRFAGEDGDNSGTFKKVPNDDFVTGNALDLVYSVYPYQESTKITNDGEITVVLPAEQSYRVDSFGLGANTMISATEGNELLFKNLCGYVMLKLYGDNVTVKSISLKGNNNEPLAGKATVSASVDNAPSLTFDSSATKEITLSFDTPITLGSTAETATTFWLVVPPTTFSKGITLTVKDDKNGVFEKSTTKSLVISRNTLSRMSSLEVEVETTQPNYVIYYTSTDGEIITPYNTNVFGSTLISNEYNNGRGVLTFDGDITRIGDKAFYQCSRLTSICVPNCVETIGYQSFMKCSELTSFTIPESVTFINDAAFYHCDALTTIDIPRNVSLMGSEVFSFCSSLSSIKVDSENPSYDSRNNCNGIISKERNTLVAGCKNTIIPESVTGIRHYAFEGCSDLKSIFIPEGVTFIEKGAFLGCTSLKTMTIPNKVTKIDQSTFYGCTNMTTVEIPNSVAFIEYAAFRDCSGLTDIILPDSLTSIGQNAFQDCYGLQSITIPSSVSDFGSGAFRGCYGITKVTILDGVTSLGSSAFSGCYGIESVTLPESISLIGDGAFNSCSGLSSISVLASTPPSIGTNSFRNTNNCPIYVPAESVEAYKSAEYWSDYASRIQAIHPPTLKDFAQEFVKGLDVWESTVGTVESDGCHLIAKGTAWENVHFIPVGKTGGKYDDHEGNQHDAKWTVWKMNVLGQEITSSQAWEIAIRGLMNMVTKEGEAFLLAMDDRNIPYTLQDNGSLMDEMPNPSIDNKWGYYPWLETTEDEYDGLTYNNMPIESVDVNFMVKAGSWHVVRAFINTAGNTPLGKIGNCQQFGTTSNTLQLNGYEGLISPMRELMVLMRIYKDLLDNNINDNVYTAIKDKQYSFDLYGITTP